MTKRIPAGGGLGGGSADAAATLLALNALWQLGLTPEQLAEIGADVGSDVPALVLAQHYRAPVLMEGRGEKVSLIPSAFNLQPPTFNLVLANPGVHSSTPEVFAHCTPRTEVATRNGDATLLSREEDGDATLLSRQEDGVLRYFNDLQPAAIALHPEIGEALSALRDVGARDVMMSGSGATVFGFAKDEDESERFAQQMRTRGYSAWRCVTL